jgi:hypothetical protein
MIDPRDRIRGLCRILPCLIKEIAASAGLANQRSLSLTDAANCTVHVVPQTDRPFATSFAACLNQHIDRAVAQFAEIATLPVDRRGPAVDRARSGPSRPIRRASRWRSCTQVAAAETRCSASAARSHVTADPCAAAECRPVSTRTFSPSHLLHGFAERRDGGVIDYRMIIPLRRDTP